MRGTIPGKLAQKPLGLFSSTKLTDDSESGAAVLDSEVLGMVNTDLANRPSQGAASSSAMKAKKSVQFLQGLFRDHNTSLLRFLTRRLSDPDDAEDIAQDAYHNLLRMETPEKLENARAYLFQTAANLALNRIRKHGRQRQYAQTVLAEGDSDRGLITTTPEQAVGAQIELQLVLDAVDELPEKCRRAFLMSRSEHKSYTQISQELGVSISTVEKYLIKSLDHLRRTVALGTSVRKKTE